MAVYTKLSKIIWEKCFNNGKLAPKVMKLDPNCLYSNEWSENSSGNLQDEPERPPTPPAPTPNKPVKPNEPRKIQNQVNQINLVITTPVS